MANEIVRYSSEDTKRIGHDLVKGTKKAMKRAGDLLVKSARDAADKEFAHRITSRVEEMLKHRNALYIARDKVNKEIAFYDRRIAAIENGEFTVDFSGEISYNDKTLQTLQLGTL